MSNTVGLLHSITRTEEKSIMQSLKKKKIAFESIDPRSLALNGNVEYLKKFSVVLNREVSRMRAELVLEYLDNRGIRTINSANATRICNNKALCTWILQKEKIPMPKTVLVFSKEEAIKQAKKIGYPIVSKPIMGSWGRLLAKISDQDTLEAIMEHREALNNPLHTFFYVQEYIEKPDRDIRVLVVGGEPTAAMYRQTDHWITNTARGAVPKKMKPDDELTGLVKKVANAVKTEIAGVDVVETSTGYQVLEANATVEFHGLQEVTDVNIADTIIDYVCKKPRL